MERNKTLRVGCSPTTSFGRASTILGRFLLEPDPNITMFVFVLFYGAAHAYQSFKVYSLVSILQVLISQQAATY